MSKEKLPSGIANTSEPNGQKTKQSRLSQTACPSATLEEALIVPRAIKDNFAGQATAPLLIAGACGIKPASSNWRMITGAAVAYGLTSGAYNAQEISITPLGERIVAPLIEGDVEIALKEAALKPTILNEFYNQYNRNKLPKADIAHNILQKKGVPVDKLGTVWSILKENATKTNILRVVSGSEYIFLDFIGTSDKPSDSNNLLSMVDDPEERIYDSESEVHVPAEILHKMNISYPEEKSEQAVFKKERPNIFISHGKNNTVIIGQLKELLNYGQMEPVISIERETTAIPVPDKVFDDMRNCDAGIIHIDLEEVPYGNGDEKYSRLNENVLIKIGAAIALYGKRVVLLCKKGTMLPSNLQGLYRCEYEGSQLDYASTMKLLKTMQELREMM